jgi:hypothetical protein
MPSPELSARLREALYAPPAWNVLRDWRCGWTDGGCLVLAEALLELLPGARGRMLQRQPHEYPTDHAFVILDGWCWDGHGLTRPGTFMRRWAREAGSRHVSVPLDAELMVVYGIRRDVARSARLAEILRGELDL